MGKTGKTGKTVKAIPDGYHTITPSFGIHGGEKAIEFYKRAFGAEEVVKLHGPGGSIAHCELQVGDSRVMFGEPMDGVTYNLHAMLYVSDCDAVVQRAVDAGATIKEAPSDKFWGDRTGRVVDPWGNEWYVATHVEDVSPEEMKQRMKSAMGG
jgi:PhnB protein